MENYNNRNRAGERYISGGGVGVATGKVVQFIPRLRLFFFFKVEISSRKPIPLFFFLKA